MRGRKPKQENEQANTEDNGVVQEKSNESITLTVLENFFDKESNIYRKKGDKFQTTIDRALYLGLVLFRGKTNIVCILPEDL